jgi:hypothetical protein
MAGLNSGPGAQTLNGFHNILKDSRRALESHLGAPLRSPLQPQTAQVHAAPPALEDLEIIALSRRAELRMEIGTDYDPVSLRAETLQNLPGVARMLTQPQDDESWMRFADAYGQSLNRIFTLPLQMSDDRTRAAMTRLRHNALSAAILAQLHLAYRQYQAALARHNAALEILNRVQDAHRIDDTDWLNAQAALVVTTAHLHTARTDLALAAGLIQSGGREPGMQQDMFLQEASFQPREQNSLLHKAGSGLMATLPAIPFVQKLSGRDGAETVAPPDPLGRGAILSLSDSKLQSLLNAPISDP